ncbi:MAG: AAA family ATPase [Gemmatales bacterium]|nr:AAA family ATPase [Gemmatales bacterium]MDW8388051.1 AAA family ATPase [Gemmatales bacterium]
MYLSHFGLTDRPFRPTADTPFYYPATGHEIALARLRQALALDEGFAVLTGETGLGKTLLLHRLIAQTEEEQHVLFVTNAHFGTAAGLYQTLLFDFGLPYEGRSEHELRLLTTEQILRTFESGRRVLLVMDEAQHLTPHLLEELRLLSNLETSEAKVVQIVLAGLPMLAEMIRRPGLIALQQRIRTRIELCPLDRHESADYVAHQIRVAGGRPEQVFSEEALEMLARACRGVPRLLNHAADLAMQLAAAGEMATVDAEAVADALHDLGLPLAERDEERSAEEANGLKREAISAKRCA